MQEQIGWLFVGAEEEENITFANYLSKLLNRPLSIRRAPADTIKVKNTWFSRSANDYELVLIQTTSRPHRQRGHVPVQELTLADRIPPSIMFLRKPRWPFYQILLVLRNHPNDDAAVEWTLRFVQESRASVTILPLLPPTPNYLRLSDYPNIILKNLIHSGTPLGALLRRILTQLDWAQIPHRVVLKRGTPDWQIALALDDDNYDLLITGGERQRKMGKWLEGNFLSTVLSNSNLPVLVAKSLQLDQMVAHA